jgi:hypothetical protein
MKKSKVCFVYRRLEWTEYITDHRYITIAIHKAKKHNMERQEEPGYYKQAKNRNAWSLRPK